MDATPVPETVPETTFFSFVAQQPKEDLANLLQYTLMSVLPAATVIYCLQEFLPPITSDAGTVQLLLEVTIGIAVVTSIMYFANRMIMYIPTWSDTPYGDISILPAMLPTVVLLLAIDMYGKVGEDTRSLGARIRELIKRAMPESEAPKKKEPTKPPSHSDYPAPGAPTGPIPPPSHSAGTQSAGHSSQNHEQSAAPDFNAMYQGAQGTTVEPFNQGGGFASF